MSAIAPSAIAIALPPTTLLITVTTVAMVKNRLRLSGGTAFLEHPSTVVVPERKSCAWSPALCR